MKNGSARFILGFFSAESGDSDDAYRAVTGSHTHACLFRADGTTQKSHYFCSAYAPLRLPGEALIVARVAPDKVQWVVQILRAFGSPAVFVIHESQTQPAVEHRESGSRTVRQRLLASLEENQDKFTSAVGDLEEALRLDHALTAAAEWLLDNAYLVRTHVGEMRRYLPRRDSRVMHALGSSESYSRLYDLARGLVTRDDCSITEGSITERLRQYQTTVPLTMAELWILPLLLRLALIEALASLAVRVSRSQQLREEAYLWANRLAAAARNNDETFNTLLTRLEAQPFALEPYFAISLAEQLQDEETALAPVQRWIEDHLKMPLAEIVPVEHTREASERISTANAFGSLRMLSRMDFAEIFEAISLVEAELRTDPAGIYARSDFTTRDDCRHVVEQIAWHSGWSEINVARHAIQLASAKRTEAGDDSLTGHVAYYLLSRGVRQLEAETKARIPVHTRAIRAVRRHATPLYLSGIILLTACFAAVVLALARDAGAHLATLWIFGAMALFPLSELATQIVNALVISLLPPGKLAKLDFREPIPAENATLVVVPMMLTKVESVRNELEKLEIRFLANQEANLSFGLLSDFVDADNPIAPDDGILLSAARDGIAALNQRYPLHQEGTRFLLFHRDREWSESEQRWIGRERKRGKLEDLNAFLCGEGSPEILEVGRLPLPIRYVITLDADTQLPPGVARKLVATAAHPLNRAQIDPVTRVRLSGYTIIQPRVSVALPDATATRFTRVFADANGTDPYCKTVSDAHQDLFEEGIFHGKAIYEVRAFTTILNDRFPPETLLSHDLIEGAHTGVGLASDIELFENLPLNYSSYSKREHRWIRGDWQIAPWIFPRVPGPDGKREKNPLSTINRWRIFDNLRRSLVPVASLLLLLFGWFISATPGVWSLVVGLAVAIPAIAPLLERSARRIQGEIQGWQGATDELIRTLVVAAFLPHQAWLSVDAMVRSIYRRRISKRNLLEWETAEAAGANAHRHLSSIRRQMLVICALSVVLIVLLAAKGAFVPTFAFIFLWMFSPALMLWLRQPDVSLERPRLENKDTLFLRQRARLTWRYFDDLVNAECHWLPPDNSQLALRIEVAQRTSPTNIGMWLTSALSARDLGYLTPDDLLARCSGTMATLDRLERYEGHYLNWYDTHTLEPLMPRYVSTVDSGNLLVSLWVLAQGCGEVLKSPVIGHSCMRGLADTIEILRGLCGRDASLAAALAEARRLFQGNAEGHELIARLRLADGPVQVLSRQLASTPAQADERAYWAARLLRELRCWTDMVDRYLPWMETLRHPPDATLRTVGKDIVKLRRRALHTAPSLATLANGVSAVDAILGHRGAAELSTETAAWLDKIATEYAAARANAAHAVQLFEGLEETANRFASRINMGFLYDPKRKLFGVGYAVGGPAEFNSHYDLLASECRLASLAAIAKGDVPAEHWMALGRPRAPALGGPVLLSWTGTMFEYLMPLLFMRSFTGSLIDRACQQAVERQIEYGNGENIPWGISESAYSALDINQIYQYRAFGVPGLALKRESENGLVVSPYSTMLALLVNPAAAIENLKRLETLGLSGPMGLYESIDFSRENQREGGRGVVIYAYMAHHQGMSLIALNDVLHRDVMQRRFHGVLRVRAFESLLFERVPITRVPWEEIETRQVPVRSLVKEEAAERTWKEGTLIPRVHLNGNGHYTLMLTNSGGGYSRWNDNDLTRWRSDTTLDPWGSYVYIHDVRSRSTWSAARQPVGGELGTSSVTFSADRGQFNRRVFGIETVMDVTVAPEDDVELRRLTITNRSLRARQLEFTSYVELVLAPHRADTAHPAFAKMFVETEAHEDGVLIARRRPKTPEDPEIWVAHMLTGSTGVIQHETDRAKFLGRGNGPGTAQALTSDLTGSTGTVLDPIFSLRCSASLEPRDRLELTFLTLAAASRDALLALVAKYRRSESVARSFEMAWTRSQLQLRYLGVRPAAAHRFHELAGQLLYPGQYLRAPASRIARNRLGQSALWAHGISGDLPMLTVTVADERGLALVRELLLAQTYWRLLGFRADIIVLNQEAASYDRPLNQQLARQIEAHAPGESTDHAGGVFLRDWNALPEADRNLILAASSVVLSGSRGGLQQQLVSAAEVVPPAAFAPTGAGHEEPSPQLPFLELPYFNGLGGFTKDAREYAIYLGEGTHTPTPWTNVMANPKFGTMVSESGLGFTWNGNSQANRLTPWHNDPVRDPQSEAIYIRDDETGTWWTPTALPIRERDAYRARHGQGYTVFEHNSHSIGQELTVFVPPADPVKVYRLKLRNDSSHTRRLTVTYFAEWVLGTVREEQQLHVQTAMDAESGALTAFETWGGSAAGHIAFAASSPKATSWSGDRTFFLGRNGSAAKPAALDRVALDKRTGTGLDPAAALQVSVTIEPGQSKEVVFLLGQADTVEAARAVIHRNSDVSVNTSQQQWDSICGALQVRTPVLSIDLLLNRWLLYQTLSCRFWGRSALYQSSGAFGFRDQLQDSMALLYSAPQLAREHILASAARQFPEGDVQHWWHPETGMGVRTRCSDDLVWLPYAVARYLEVTGDTGILDEQIHFLEGPLLPDHEQEHLSTPAVSADTAPLWEHCRRALDHAWRIGAHGLPLIGNGDWNDGLNRVGVEGKGESVWLAWFLCDVLKSFALVMEKRDAAVSATWVARAADLAGAVERSSWDGEWYLRGFFDNGSPLGSKANAEARIDSLPQSWAVISGAGDPARAKAAMESADRELVKEKDGLVLLFTPPFDHSQPNPGYIMGYPPGIRENGGQYTHGSLWFAAAQARLGHGDRAVHLLQMMNPIEHSRDPESAAHYAGEPYVSAADVYSAVGRVGRAGWTWYTGSAAWMYRVWIEEVLGFQLRGNSLSIQPVIPADWKGFEITYRYRSSVYEIRVKNGSSQNITIDGRGVAGAVELVDDGKTHQLVVEVPRRVTEHEVATVAPAQIAGSNGTRPAQVQKDDVRLTR